MLVADIQQGIRDFLVETFLFGKNDGLTDDSPLLDTVIDSHGVLEFVVFLQDRFAIHVDDEDVNTQNLDSVNKTANFVLSKLAQSRAVTTPST